MNQQHKTTPITNQGKNRLRRDKKFYVEKTLPHYEQEKKTMTKSVEFLSLQNDKV